MTLWEKSCLTEILIIKQMIRKQAAGSQVAGFLIVDDTMGNLEQPSETLKANGYRVRPVTGECRHCRARRPRRPT